MSKPSGAQVRAAQVLAQARGGAEVDELPLRLGNLTSVQRAEALALITELLPRIVHRAPAAAAQVEQQEEAADVEPR